MMEEIELVKYRDWGMHTFTYFWVNKNRNIVSPYFESEDAAMKWAEEKNRGNV
jgi:hypothetical protein